MIAFDGVGERVGDVDVPCAAGTVRAVGAIIAAGIAIAVAVVGLWLVPGSGWVLGIAGLPGTTWLAWRLAPRAVRGGVGDAVTVAVELGALAIVVADALVVAVLLAWAAINALGAPHVTIDPSGAIGGVIQVAVSSVALMVIGAFIFGIPAAIVVLPAAFLWTFLVRRIVRAAS
jgi:hypothetical protein